MRPWGRPWVSSASATRASRAETPTRRPPVISFSNASRTEGLQASSQPATMAGKADFGASASVSTTSDRLGGGALVRAAGQISATVSARSPT